MSVEPREAANTKVRLATIEHALGIRLCRSYRDFLLGAESFVIDGYKICSQHSSTGELSVLESTLVLRGCRPDLSTYFAAIAFSSQFALCLDGSTSSEDAPLVQVDLRSQLSPTALGCTFSE